MERFSRAALALGLFIMCATSAAADTRLLTIAKYRLLSLDGNLVKWGQPTLGTSAQVTYAFLNERMTFPGTRNCGAMAPFADLAPAAGHPEAELRDEARAAFAEWQTAAAITFSEVEQAAAADIVIGVQTVPSGWAFTNVAPAGLGVTEKALGRDSGRAASDIQAAANRPVAGIQQSLICINPAKRWKVGFGGNLKIYDIRQTLAHEIGHAIGLDHPGAAGGLMGF